MTFYILVAGDLSSYNRQSDFINRINWIDTDEEHRIPPAEKITETDIQKLECWIESGYPQ